MATCQIRTETQEAFAVSLYNCRIYGWVGNRNDQGSRMSQRAVWITCAEIFLSLSMASTGKNKAKDTSHKWDVTGWMGRTMWSGGDKGLNHVCWEVRLQMQAESGALTTPQSATGSQFDIHHLVASASFLPRY